VELIDTHAHLDDRAFDDDRAAVIARCHAEGIGVITVGVDLRSSGEAARLAERHRVIWAGVGVHPHEAKTYDPEVERELRELAAAEKVVAIGEIGLDYWYRGVRKNPEKRELQRRLFVELLELARAHGKPVSIHSRGAWRDCVDLVIKSGIERAVFHWFSGPQDALEDLLRHGYYVSATPAVAYSREHRRVVMNTPLDRLLLETDSPVEYRGVVSEPAHLLRTLSEVAILKGAEKNVIAKKTTENARRLFRI